MIIWQHHYPAPPPPPPPPTISLFADDVLASLYPLLLMRVYAHTRTHVTQVPSVHTCGACRASQVVRHTFTHVSIFTYSRMYPYFLIHVFPYSRISVFTYVAHTFMHMHAHTHTHTHMCTHTHTHTHTHAHMHTHARARTHTNVRMQAGLPKSFVNVLRPFKTPSHCTYAHTYTECESCIPTSLHAYMHTWAACRCSRAGPALRPSPRASSVCWTQGGSSTPSCRDRRSTLGAGRPSRRS